jgi:hypothetical protein
MKSCKAAEASGIFLEYSKTPSYLGPQAQTICQEMNVRYKKDELYSLAHLFESQRIDGINIHLILQLTIN